MSHFTDDIYSDKNILLQLDLYDLLSLCNTNEYLRDLCVNDTFWRDKIMNDFSPVLLEYKPDSITYRDQYIYLHNSDINNAIEDCRIDGILNNYKYLDRTIVNGIFEYCPTGNILKMLNLG